MLNNPLGKILRINSDGTIPIDNPFYNDGDPGTGNDDRIWAYGLRNSFDFCFSPFNDSLYATENGPIGNDEVNFIRKGKNYGWPICSGYCNPYNPAYRQPMTVIPNGTMMGYVPTGTLIYSANELPELNGKLLIIGASTLNTNQYAGLIRCEMGNAPFNDTITSWTTIIPGLSGTTLKQDSDGFIYLLRFGSLVRIKSNTIGISINSNPVNYLLLQNYPNPFNPVTKINYQLPKTSKVNLLIYDIQGRVVIRLINSGIKESGWHSIEFNAQNYPSGVYFYRIEAGDFVQSKKMVLVK
jgi:hypothetical protein